MLTHATEPATRIWTTPATGLAFYATLSAGAVFGFFYAWVCSTMWGLDTADPRVAIEAMNAMNGSVRNGVFALGFFGTPLVLALSALLLALARLKVTAVSFGIATLFAVATYVITTTYHVPLNLDLMDTTIPQNRPEAQAIWTAYSSEWQFYNQIRTFTSGLALAAAAFGLLRLRTGP